jgi:hypothetical protein
MRLKELRQARMFLRSKDAGIIAPPRNGGNDVLPSLSATARDAVRPGPGPPAPIDLTQAERPGKAYPEAMALSRQLRRWVSGALVMTILFTQLAVAAYACPTAEQAAHVPSTAMAGMPDCHDAEEGEDLAQPQLCKAHCANEAQSSVRAATPDLQPNPASVALLQRVIEPAAPVVFAISHARAAPLTDPPDPLPLYLSLLVLRN